MMVFRDMSAMIRTHGSMHYACHEDAYVRALLIE
jgi:hypothetical protein